MLPELFRRTKQGKTMSWKIIVEDDSFYTISQYLPNGKQKISDKTICTPKNVGKTNETSAQEQAYKQAHSLWTKKKQQQFQEQLPTEGISEPQYIRPMLAQTYSEKTDKKLPLVFGIVPKLDGVRAIAHSDRMYSRNGHEFPFLTHIKKQLETLIGSSDIVLDGELYTHHFTFNDLMKLIRPTKNQSENETLLQYWIFDIVSDDPYETRMSHMRSLQKRYNTLFPSCETIQFLYSTPIQRDELSAYHELFLEHGYEGSILRNLHAPYQKGVRSFDLMKYKSFQDDEFEIVDFRSGNGSDTDAVILQCKTKDNKLFFVKPKGSLDYRQELYRCGKTLIGKWLTVRYQELSTDGIPRFPVGFSIRDYE